MPEKLKEKPFARLLNMRLLLTVLLLSGMYSPLLAQDPLRFEKQVADIKEEYANISKEDLILFTGSSSIRGWKDLPDYFPDHNLMNAGFGGSHTSDLLYYLDELVVQFQPKKVFIYEGDNDISSGKPTEEIMDNTKKIVDKLQASLPGVKILLISAKPSISRWHLKDQYLDFNKHLRKYSRSTKNVKYVNIWDIMMDKDKKPRADIFLEDDLHMNKAGYDLWAKVVKKYL